MPLRRFADFSGRSTRTELGYFWLFTMLVGLGLNVASEFAVSITAGILVRSIFALVLACPWTALFVRRLHDTGRSGWWLLLGLPAVAISLWDDWHRLGDPFAPSVRSTLPGLIAMLLTLGVLMLMAMVLWSDHEEANRYGPNPRYGEREAAA